MTTADQEPWQAHWIDDGLEEKLVLYCRVRGDGVRRRGTGRSRCRSRGAKVLAPRVHCSGFAFAHVFIVDRRRTTTAWGHQAFAATVTRTPGLT